MYLPGPFNSHKCYRSGPKPPKVGLRNGERRRQCWSRSPCARARSWYGASRRWFVEYARSGLGSNPRQRSSRGSRVRPRCASDRVRNGQAGGIRTLRGEADDTVDRLMPLCVGLLDRNRALQLKDSLQTRPIGVADQRPTGPQVSLLNAAMTGTERARRCVHFRNHLRCLKQGGDTFAQLRLIGLDKHK